MTKLGPHEAMERALAVAEHARYQAPPNPWVGCVLLRDGVVVGEGCTQRPGHEHAEIQALKQAGERARGSTAYVTLEPCSHHGKTPPCVEALVRCGVTHVVAAIEDPDSKVAGSGLSELKRHGITTEVGLLADKAQHALRAYLHQRRTGSAYCVAKAAISVDGRLAAADGSSQWITCEASRTDAHRLRVQSQAVMIGVGTAIADNPSLTSRYYQPLGFHQPLRVILDSTGRLPAQGPLFDTSEAPTLILTTEKALKDQWKGFNVEVELIPEGPQGVDLGAALKLLGARGILQVLVEGGPTLLGALWKGNHINELSLFVGPRILGDKGLPLFAGLGITSINEAPSLTLLGHERFGSCVRMDFRP